MAKEWKDSQKAVDKLIPLFDEFMIEVNKRNEVYTVQVPEELKAIDPVYQYVQEIKETLEAISWNI